MSTTIRNANLGDLYGIKNLYLDITEKYPDNLTPFTNEVTDEFIYEGLQAALERGGALVMVKAIHQKTFVKHIYLTTQPLLLEVII